MRKAELTMAGWIALAGIDPQEFLDKIPGVYAGDTFRDQLLSVEFESNGHNSELTITVRS